MKALLESILMWIQNSNLATLFIDASLKSIIILTVAGVVCACCRRASASARHLIWFVAVLSLPMVSLVPLVLPSWAQPLWQLSTSIDSGNQLSLALQFAPESKPALSEQAKQSGPRLQETAPALGGGQNHGSNFTMRLSPHWLVLALFIWLIGVLFTFCSVWLGALQLHSLCRHARSLQDGDWATLLRHLSSELQIRRPVFLLQSSQNVIPITWGSLWPAVLLPADCEQWPAERRRIVLLHELAHVKRYDSLTQMIAGLVCALYWFNPLVWVAARRMCVERESACDDLVLNGGCKPSDYATHLVSIATTFRRVPNLAAIAMARSSRLENRISAIVDGSRPRRLQPATVFIIWAVVGAVTIFQGGCKTGSVTGESSSLRQQQIARLQSFSVAKEKQSRALAAEDGDRFHPDFAKFFKAAVKGDGKTVTNLYESFKKRHGQYENTTDDLPHKSYWSPVLEVALGYYEVMAGDPKYEQLAIDGMINSVPRGSIFFGGTDPGRGLPTAFSRSHVNADPFFTLTQNALADGSYLEYLRRTYGGKIYTPTDEDSQKSFQEYLADAQRRLKENKLKAGEDVKVVDGKVQVSGQVAVMEINARLAKIIFDKNPNHEFYIEESFPLEWMYPHLSPNGSIMKLNRQPLTRLTEETIKRDREYWRARVSEMVGNWLTEDTSVQTVTDFVEKVYARRNLQNFRGDPLFIHSEHAQKLFSKLRSSIGGVYAWRVANTEDPTEKQRMVKEADFVFRQAFAICPHSPEAIFRYINLLVSVDRLDDALLIAEAALKVQPASKQIQDLIKELNNVKSAKKVKP